MSAKKNPAKMNGKQLAELWAGENGTKLPDAGVMDDGVGVDFKLALDNLRNLKSLIGSTVTVVSAHARVKFKGTLGAGPDGHSFFVTKDLRDPMADHIDFRASETSQVTTGLNATVALTASYVGAEVGGFVDRLRQWWDSLTDSDRRDYLVSIGINEPDAAKVSKLEYIKLPPFTCGMIARNWRPGIDAQVGDLISMIPVADGDTQAQVGSHADEIELLRGIEHEKEHAGTLRWIIESINALLQKVHYPNARIEEIFREGFKRIAQDHLREIPDYYTRLARMEAEAKASVSCKQEVGMADEYSPLLQHAIDSVNKMGRYLELIAQAEALARDGTDTKQPLIEYVRAYIKDRQKGKVEYSMGVIAEAVLKLHNREKGPVLAPVFSAIEEVAASVSKSAELEALVVSHAGHKASTPEIEALVHAYPYVQWRTILRGDLLKYSLIEAAAINARVAESAGYDLTEFAAMVRRMLSGSVSCGPDQPVGETVTEAQGEDGSTYRIVNIQE